MSNEIRIQASLQIPDLTYIRSKAFSANLLTTGGVGPSPAEIQATTAGTQVSFASLLSGHPGVCWLQNLSSTYYILVGMFDPTTTVFYPMLELAPGEAYPVRLYRYIGEEEGIVGTATSGQNSVLMVKGVGATVPCLVEAFDR